MIRTQQQRILLGLKLRQLRLEKGWNFEELRHQTGISASYLNEIEKGKKFPQPDNFQKLAAALGVSPAYLESPDLDKQFAPLGELLQSNFLNELPLDLFGIDLQQVVEIIARAPDRVNAFISALLEIARNYSLREENFYFAALRAYQELRMNYFEEIEAEADIFVARQRLPTDGGVSAERLAHCLSQEFGYHIDEKGLGKYPELQSLRSVYQPRKRRLLLNPALNSQQKAFQLAKELGFNVLGLMKERPLASNILRAGNFEETLNNYKAAYFAVAVLIHREAFIRDLSAFFEMPVWDGSVLPRLMQKYQAGPEVFFQRFNVLSKAFNLHKVFFMRFIHHLQPDTFEIDKELHLNRRHQPHASGLNEKYCRRWPSITLLRDLQWQQSQPQPPDLIAGAQRCHFLNTHDEYLCVAAAKPAYPTVGRNVSVTLGVLLDDTARRTIRFWDDPDISRRVVNITCERCPLEPCAERAAPPFIVKRREERKRMQEVLARLTG
jgi:transcriptional regulator with XRE-family HTH domain